jgi:hypothetical protein
MSRKQFAGLFLSSMLALGPLVAGQTSAIEGTVRGADGKPLKAADVRLDAAKVPLLTKTDASGKYRFSNLNPGVYKVTILSGSKVLGINEAVRVNGTRKLDFDLRPATAAKPAKHKHYIWVPSNTGSHIGGNWIEVNEFARVDEGNGAHAETLNIEHAKAETMQDMQRRQNPGLIGF